jgi:hypothetical protein
VPLETITRREVLLLAIRMAGALEITGTADSGSTSTLVEDILVHPNTNQLLGHNIYILNGTAQGDDRIISAFTPGSDRVTVVPNFSGAIDTSSVYVILKRPWRIQAFIDGINHATRLGRESGILVNKSNYELIGQDILMGQGNFVTWANGAAAAPDGWTVDGNSTIARRTENPKVYLPYSVRITTDGSNLGSLTMSITNFAAYRGQVVDLRGFLRTNTASRLTIDVTDGVTTQTSTVGPTFSSIRNQTSALPVPADWPIHLIGYESAPILTSDDTNVSMNATFLATYAAWFAATTTPLGSQFDEGLVQKIPMWERQWQGMLRAMDTRPRAGSIRAYDY